MAIDLDQTYLEQNACVMRGFKYSSHDSLCLNPLKLPVEKVWVG